MTTRTHRYHMNDWKETTLEERPDGAKLTRVEAAFTYEGELSGATRVYYLMRYRPDGKGAYEGWERFEGTFRGTAGGALLRHTGTFDAEGVDARVETAPGTGTGSLVDVALKFSTRFAGHGPYEIQVEAP